MAQPTAVNNQITDAAAPADAQDQAAHPLFSHAADAISDWELIPLDGLPAAKAHTAEEMEALIRQLKSQ
ncbi:hypothetical protein [Chromobacterium sp. IIBBL 290-4]|uniref:hypothetical protein n=1 Tax=Chromobacterium sp. IIBBL 290-4 TaxID=2953890 RepID=UPI0020B818A1|nr:hypothetical protein [Chromobacterium sp. IIBBL 290-4]UTH72314.1 hypothetical protein NKT35_12180 [Chromobacterium sp. IIBBL 290-4]